VQIDHKIHRILVFLTVSEIIMILALMVILVSNNAFAQTVHDRTLYEIVKQTSTVNEGPQIYVGNSPGDIVASFMLR